MPLPHRVPVATGEEGEGGRRRAAGVLRENRGAGRGQSAALVGCGVMSVGGGKVKRRWRSGCACVCVHVRLKCTTTVYSNEYTPHPHPHHVFPAALTLALSSASNAPQHVFGSAPPLEPHPKINRMNSHISPCVKVWSSRRSSTVWFAPISRARWNIGLTH